MPGPTSTTSIYAVKPLHNSELLQIIMATDTETLRGYYETLRGTEHAKNQLIEDLLKRLDSLSQEHQQEKLDHARESHFNREVQRREQKLLDELRLIRTSIVGHCGAWKNAT